MLTRFTKIFSIKNITLLFCASFLFFGVVTKAQAATYYVANAGNDSCNGTSQTIGSSGTCAWKTISHVNSQTFVGDDQILFNSGDVWRETLTVPSSGTSGHSITFGAYGSGNKPIINGADLITGWAVDAGTVQTMGPYSSPADLAGSWLVRTSIDPNTFSSDGTRVRITITAGSSGASVTGVYVGQKAVSGNASDMEPGTISQFLFSGSGTVVLAAGASVTSDWLTYSFDHTKTYLSSIGATTGIGYFQGVLPQANSYFKSGAQASAGTGVVAGMTTSGNFTSWGMKSFEVQQGVGLTNVWNATVTTHPYFVAANGTVSTAKASKAALASPGDWYWTGNTLSIYSTSDPTTAFTSPGVEASARTTGILISAKNYITVDRLDMKYQTINGVYSTGTNTIVQNSSAEYLGGADTAWASGIRLAGANSSALGNNIQHTLLHGIMLLSSGAIAKNNVCNYNWNGIEYPSQTGRGVDINGATGAIVEYNSLTGNSGGILDYNSQDSLITYNLISNSHVNGIDHNSGVSGHPALIYNNTVIHNPAVSDGHGIVAQLTGGYATIKNNIVYTTFTGTNNNVQSYAIESSAYSGIDIDYNLAYNVPGSTANLYKLNTNLYDTLGAWQTAISGTSFLGKDAHSTSTDPKFTNAGSSNFTLLSTSPAIDNGFNLGSTYKLGLNPNSVWPSSVNTLDQTLNGSNWEIGAYVYTQSPAPTVSISAPSAGAISGSVSVTATAGATAPATVSSVQFYLDGVALQSADVSSPYSITWDTTTATNASHTLTAVATDNYTNTTTSAGVVVTIDNLGPTGTIANGNGTPTNSVTPTFNLTIADAGVGITGAQMQFSCDGVTWSNWQSYATSKTDFNVKTGEGCANVDGTKTVYVKYEDSLNNVGSAYSTTPFTLDTASANAALSGTPASITKSTSASVTVAGTDITDYKYKLDSGAYSDEIAVAIPITLSSLSDDLHTLSVIGKDSAGNWQAEIGATTYSWTVDTTAPVVTFSISATSNSLTFPFTTFSATDANGVTGYLVNETATTPDVSDAGWSGTAQTQYVFTTEGAKTLYAWAKDSVGNISTSGSGTVTVTLPVVVSGGGPLITGSNGPIVGSLGGHRQDISNLLAPTISVTPTTIIPGCKNGTNGFSITTGQSCLGNTGGTTTTIPPTLPKYNFTRNLSLHSTGKDVKALQQFLNANGFLIAKTGAGSPGKETTLFGTLTYKALVKFQKSLGWSGTGFFGPMTREYIKNK